MTLEKLLIMRLTKRGLYAGDAWQIVSLTRHLFEMGSDGLSLDRASESYSSQTLAKAWNAVLGQAVTFINIHRPKLTELAVALDKEQHEGGDA